MLVLVEGKHREITSLLGTQFWSRPMLAGRKGCAAAEQGQSALFSVHPLSPLFGGFPIKRSELFACA